MEKNLNRPKPSVLTPPSPEITIRTMESDIKAIEQGGGEMITPQPFTPEQSKAEESKAEIKLDIPGYVGPEKPIFAPASSVLTEESPEKKTNKWKVVGIIIGVSIIIVGLGLLGYFVASSWLFPKEMPAVQ